MHSRYGTRKPNRASGFDYRSPGPCFVTICVQERRCLFGSVADDAVRLNMAGTMVAGAWRTMARQFRDVQFDDSVVMPNHVHALLTLPLGDADGPELGTIIQAFKRLTPHRYVEGVKACGWPKFDGRLWQRSFHDHIVRNDRDMDRLREYIVANPALWAEDRLYAEG